MKRALVNVTPELIAEKLQLPRDTVIDGAVWDPRIRAIVLSVQHPDFYDVRAEHQAPNVIFRVESTWVR